MSKDQEEDLSQVEFETSDDVEVINSFDQMRLGEDLLRGVYAYGFEKPTAIQQRAIKPITKGRDVIAQAQSGTGKTGTFSIAALQLVDTSIRETQCLILGPTRELVQQMQKVILALGDYLNIQCHCCMRRGVKKCEDWTFFVTLFRFFVTLFRFNFENFQNSSIIY